eukprot:130641_1
MAIVHIYYALHFTRFSLSYLNAKCEEKRALSTWCPTKIYIKTISSYYNKSIQKVKVNADIDTHLWTQFQIIRNILRVVMFVLCWIVLILYITLAINILFEFFFACLQSVGSRLALIVLPPYIFINTAIIRQIFNGIMCTWSINADLIADAIVQEQSSAKAKKDALKSTIHISHIPHGDEQSVTAMFTETPSATQTPTPKEEEKVLIKQTFFSPYFMAVRWRLCVVFLSVLFTLIALPTMSFTVGDELITDTFWFQLFLRYMVLAVGIWLFIYFCLEALFGLFGRISSLAVYSDINDWCDSASPQALKRIRICREVLRFLCLLDAFGLSDTS